VGQLQHKLRVRQPFNDTMNLQVSPWRAKGAGLLTAAIVFIYTSVSPHPLWIVLWHAKASSEIMQNFNSDLQRVLRMY